MLMDRTSKPAMTSCGSGRQMLHFVDSCQLPYGLQGRSQARILSPKRAGAGEGGGGGGGNRVRKSDRKPR